MNENDEPRALREVREWKAACARDVADLEIGAALRKRLQDSAEAARRLGFLVGGCAGAPVAHVAEAATGYGAGEEDAAGRMNATRAKRGE